MAKYDFIAIDFETATSRMDSACAVGLAGVKDGKIVSEYYTLLCPPDNQYDPHNIEIHGITPDDTADAPPAWALWPSLREILSNELVVAHNAKFDMSVIHQSMAQFDYCDIDFKYIDSMSVVGAVASAGQSLEECAGYFGIDMGTHHNALDDAKTCAKIVIASVKQSGYESMAEFFLYTPKISINRFSKLHPITDIAQSKKPHQKRESIKYAEIHAACSDIDPNGPLYGKLICFTGELSMDRRTALQLAADAGAVVKSSVSKKLDYLVVGAQDKDIVGEDGKSSKEEKAETLNAEGKAHIQIIGEAEFLAMISAKG